MRNGATGAGALLALAIMAMTIGLIRSEATADVRILSATGATSGNRRTLTATTAAALAMLGARLGTAGAYLGYGAGHLNDLGALTPVPLGHLLIIVGGLPVVAAAAGALMGGHELAWLARALD